MRAVNLIPTEDRRGGRFALSQLSPATFGLLGALLAAVVVVTAIVLIGNATNDRRDEAARINAQAETVRRQADALAPDLAVVQARERSVAAVRSLVGTRYDWSRLLGSVSRRLPRKVTLTNFNGSIGGAGTAAPAQATTSPGVPTAGATVGLTGCAASLHTIATLMERMRRIDGVQGVTFTTSSKTSSAGGAAGCRYPRSFDVSIALTGPSATITGGSS